MSTYSMNRKVLALLLALLLALSPASGLTVLAEQPPQVTLSPGQKELEAGGSCTVRVSLAHFEEGEEVSFALGTDNSALVGEDSLSLSGLGGDSALLTISPAQGQTGSALIRVTAVGSVSGPAWADFSLTVVESAPSSTQTDSQPATPTGTDTPPPTGTQAPPPAQRGPVILGGPATGTDATPTVALGATDVLIQIGETTTVAITASGSDALTLEATHDNDPLFVGGGLTLSGTGGSRTLEIVPGPGQSGQATVTVTARDGLLSAQAVLQLRVNAPPALTLTPTSLEIAANGSGAVNIALADEDVAGVTLAAGSDNPALVDAGGLVFSTGTDARTLTITPQADTFGTAVITVTATDAHGGRAAAQLTLTVADDNTAPTLAVTPDTLSMREDETATVEIRVEDDQDDLAGLPVALEIASDNEALVDAGGLRVSPTSGAVRTLTVTPRPNAFGTAVLTVTATDSKGKTAARTLTLTVTEHNAAPTIPAAHAATVLEDGVYTFDFADIATDTDGDALFYAIGSLPSHGAASLTDGALTYTPHPDYNGADSLTVEVSDGRLSASCVVSVTVTPVADPPMARDDAATATSSGGAILIDVLDNDGIVDTDTANALVITTVTNASRGAAEIVHQGGQDYIRYTPDPRQSGVDTFTYAVRHNVGDNSLVATATVAVTIVHANIRPEIQGLAATYTTAEDTPFVITFTVYDPDVDDPKTGFGVNITSSNPAILPPGGLAVSTPTRVDENTAAYTLTCTPAPDQNGPVSLTIAVTEQNAAQNNTASAAVAVVVAPVNDAPVLASLSSAYYATESTAGTEIFTIEFSVWDVDMPAGQEFAVEAAGDNGAVLPVSGLSVERVNSQSGGKAGYRLTLRFARYTNTAQHGPLNITITAKDNAGALASATVAVHVANVNNPPTAQNNSYTINEDTPTTFDVLANDSDPDGHGTFTIVGVTGNMAGSTATITDGGRAIRYTPKQDHYGDDQFVYTIEDDGGYIATATVAITIVSVNDPPEISGLLASYTTAEDTPIQIDFAVFDVETAGADTLMVQEGIASGGGLIASTKLEVTGDGSGRRLTITPAAHKNGEAVFSLTVSDGVDTCVQTFRLTITPVNDKPMAVDDRIAFTEDTPVKFEVSTLLKNDYDVDTDDADPDKIFFVGVVTPPLHGVLEVLATGSDGLPTWYRYTPDANWDKNDSFTYQIRDKHSSYSDAATVTLVCTAVNDAPVLATLSDVVMNEDGTVTVPLFFSDQETAPENLIVSVSSDNPDVITISGLVITRNPPGTTPTGGILTITPLADKFTTTTPTTIEVSVSDRSLSVQRSFRLTVNSVNDRPVAQDDSYQTTDASALTISPLDNDYDVDPGDTLTIVSISSPTHGTLVDHGNGTYTYTSRVAFEGTETLVYTVTDSTSLTATATIAIQVRAQGVSPSVNRVSNIVTFAGAAMELIDLEVLNVLPHMGYTLTVTSSNEALIANSTMKIDGTATHTVSTPTAGTVPTHKLGLTLEPGAVGEAYITVRVESGGEEGTMSFRVLVNRDNHPPTATDYTVKVPGTQSVIIDVLASCTDVEQPLRLTLLSVGKPSRGTAEIVRDGGQVYIKYTPSGGNYGSGSTNSSNAGTATCAYTIVDGGGAAAVGTININILPVNRGPVIHTDVFVFEYGDIGTPTSINPLRNDYDSDGDTLYLSTITSVSSPTSPLAISASGTTADVTPTAPGWYQYTYSIKSQYRNSPTAAWDYSGNATIWIGVKDEGGALPPKALGNSWWVNEDSGTRTYDLRNIITSYPSATSVEIRDHPGYEVTNRKLATVVYTPTSGSFDFVYTPNPNQHSDKDKDGNALGSLRLQYRASNDGGTTYSDWADLTVRVWPVNDAPELDPIATQTVARGQALTLTLDVSDVDNRTKDLTISAISDDNNKVFSENISIRYVTATDTWELTIPTLRDGDVTITITASDGFLTDTQSFVLTIIDQNSPPIITSPTMAQTIKEDTKAAFTVINALSDPDNDPLTILCGPGTGSATETDGTGFVNAADAALGTLQCAGDKIMFTPHQNVYHQHESEYIEIKYRLKDMGGLVSQETGLLRVHIQPVNDAPVIINIMDQYTMPEGKPYTVTYKVKDPDLGLMWNGTQLVTGTHAFSAEHGDPDRIQELKVEAQGPDANHEYTLALTITPQPYANHAPGATPTDITVKASYVGAANIATPTHTFALTITAVNDPPVMIATGTEPLLFEIREDEPLTIDLVSHFIDPDGDEVTIIQVSNDVTRGVAENQNNQVLFRPAANYFTPASPTETDYAWVPYIVSDPFNAQYKGRIKIKITPVNDAPEAPNFKVSVLEDTPLVIENLSDHVTDVDNAVPGEIALVAVSTPSHGTLTMTPGAHIGQSAITYIPDADWHGTDSFAYTVQDLDGEQATGIISVTVTPVADEPRMAFETTQTDWRENASQTDVVWVMDEDEVKTFRFRMWDPETPADNLILRISCLDEKKIGDDTELLPFNSNIVFGGVKEDRTLTLTPLANQYGEVWLKFLLSDGPLHTTEKWVKVIVRSVNDPPVMQGQSFATKEDTSYSGSISASDMETHLTALKFSVPASPTHGQITSFSYANGTCNYTYTPNADWYGTDTFQIRVEDTATGEGAAGVAPATSTTATITVKVDPENDKPTAPQNVALNKTQYRGGETLTLTWLAGTDKANETPREDLAYTIQYTVNGSTWLALTPTTTPTKAADSWIYTCTWICPAVNTDKFQIQVRTNDDGHPTPGNPLSSGYTKSAISWIDAAQPGANPALNPDTWTNGPVEIALNPTDTSAGASGVATVTSPAGVSVTDAAGYKYSVAVNGTYSFDIADRAGNIRQNYLVTVTSIDKLNPNTSCGLPAGSQGFAETPLTATLTYADAPADALYGQSGIAANGSLYQLTHSSTAPAAGDAGWLTYPSTGVEMAAKGTWYLHARAVDRAGNAVTGTYGPYVIHNTPPVARDVSATVYEHATGTHSNRVKITLDAADADGDTLTYAIVGGPNSYDGALTKESNGVYWFQHSGTDPIHSAVTFTYKATDNDSTPTDSNVATVTVAVVEVNDLPTFTTAPGTLTTAEDTPLTGIVVRVADNDDLPAALSVTATSSKPAVIAGSGIVITRDGGDPSKFTVAITPVPNAFDAGGVSITLRVTDAKGGTTTHTFTVMVTPVNDLPTQPDISYSGTHTRVGESITVSWSKSLDVETTPTYDLEVYDGSAWRRVLTETTALTHNYRVPSGFPDTKEMLFRVRAWDGVVHTLWSFGAPAGGYTSPTHALGSGTVLTCDSTRPTLTLGADVTTWTNAPVTVTWRAADATAGLDAATVTSPGGTASIGPLNGAASATDAVTLYANGRVSVAAMDLCGNVFDAFYDVANIDTATPTAAVTAKSNGSTYTPGASPDSNHPIDLTLVFSDTGGSGIHWRKVALTATATTPASHQWQDWAADTYTTQLGLIDTYYLHAQVADTAGNVNTLTFGPYVIINTLPVAHSQSERVNEGGSVTVTLRAEDGDPLDHVDSYHIAATPTHGVLSPGGSGNVFIYTHDGSENHADAFTFYVMDGRGSQSNVATITVAVTPVNDPPLIKNLPAATHTDQDEPFAVEFDLEDPDNAAAQLRVSVVSSNPAALPVNRMTVKVDPLTGHVILRIRPVLDVYTSPGGSPVELTITVRDPGGLADTKVIQIDLDKVNHVPTLGDQSYFVPAGETVYGTLTAADRDGDSLTYLLVSDNTTQGTLTTATDFDTSGAFSYTAGSGFMGSDTFVAMARDNGIPPLDSAHATVTILSHSMSDEDLEVNGLNFTSSALGGHHAFARSWITTDNSTLLPAANCSFTLDDTGRVFFRYLPARDQYGTVNVILFVEEGGTTYQQPFRIEITAVNDPPKAPDIAKTIIRGQALSGKIAASDAADGQFAASSFTFSCDMLHQPAHGTLTLATATGAYTYTPAAGFVGQDVFYVTVKENDSDPLNRIVGALPDNVIVNDDDTLSVLVRVAVTVNAPTPPPNPGGNSNNNPGGSGGSGRDSDSGGGSGGFWSGYLELPPEPEALLDVEGPVDPALPPLGGDGSASLAPGTETPPEAPPNTDPAGQTPPPLPPGEAPPTAAPAIALTPEISTPRGTDALWWALPLLAALLLLVLLAGARIRLRYTWTQSGGARTLERTRWCRRIRRKGGLELDLSDPDLPGEIRADVTISFGSLYRRRGFYRRDIRLALGDREARAQIPDRKTYRQEKALRLHAGTFEERAET